MKKIKTKLLILGSGPAGCTAGIYAARSNLSPIIIQGLQPGGQLTITTDVENYPGYSDPVQGPWLMQQMTEQAKNVGCIIENKNIKKIELNGSKLKFNMDDKVVYCPDSVIIATGASAKWLNIEGENEFRGYGVSACATCDAFFFKNKSVVVVGGGNTAIEEAIFLTKFAKEVIVIHRRNKLRADKILQERAFSNKKISFIWDSKVEKISGTSDPKMINSVVVKSLKTGENKKLETDGIFIAIGHKPNTDMFKGFLDLDQEGYIITNNHVITNISGVFAAGDVHDKIYRQAVTAAGFGCMAALEAEKYLESIE